MQKNYSISAIRAIAMIMIVVCHWLQARGNLLAWHFNVGVDVFFALSGYCFGGKDIDDIGSFFKKRILRILVPFYVFIVLAVILFNVFGCDTSIKDILKLLCIQTGTQGFGHIWFVPCILVLYLFTPYLQKLMPLIINGAWAKDLIRCACVVVMFALWALTHRTCLPFQAFAGYFVGYALAYEKRYHGDTNVCKLMCWTAAFGIMCFCGRIALDFYGVSLGAMIQYAKFVSGIGLLGLGILSFNKLKLPLLDWSDRYSYEVYLCHHIFLLGPLSSRISSGWGGGGNMCNFNDFARK